jgi:aspartate/methionine/tyrosine aminotransferase
MRLSTRSARDRTKNALALALEEAQRAGRHVLDLTESNPTRCGIDYPEGALTALGDPAGRVYHPSPFGLRVAREAVARTYEEVGITVDPSRILLTASTSEAYAHLFKLLCDDGDEVLVPEPCYPLLDHLARLEGVRLVPYALAYDGEWHLDVPTVHRAIGPRSRAIVVVHPNNPTGSYMKREELAALSETGLPLVSDEVFASYGPFPMPSGGGLDSHRPKSVLEHAEGLVFALGGLSKMAALPQVKLAWIVTAGPDGAVREVLERLELIADTFLSVSTPVQLAAPLLLASRNFAGDAIRARLAKNLATAGRTVTGSPVSVLRVEGGWYQTLRLPATRTEEEWVLRLLRQDGVYVHPGHFFDFASEAYVVTSLLTPEDAYEQGLARIVARARA